MANNLDDFQRFRKEQLEVVTTLVPSYVKSFQTIATETAEYSKKSLEDGAAFFEKLRGAKSFESAIQIQSEYAKVAYTAFIEQAKKFGELYSNHSKVAFKPIEAGLAKIQSGKE
jgi:hypothetical protein